VEVGNNKKDQKLVFVVVWFSMSCIVVVWVVLWRILYDYNFSPFYMRFLIYMPLQLLSLGYMPLQFTYSQICQYNSFFV
jgi:hypothetical protein